MQGFDRSSKLSLYGHHFFGYNYGEKTDQQGCLDLLMFKYKWSCKFCYNCIREVCSLSLSLAVFCKRMIWGLGSPCSHHHHHTKFEKRDLIKRKEIYLVQRHTQKGKSLGVQGKKILHPLVLIGPAHWKTQEKHFLTLPSQEAPGNEIP